MGKTKVRCYFHVIIKEEQDGTWNAYVPGFSIYATGVTRVQVMHDIYQALTDHIAFLQKGEENLVK